MPSPGFYFRATPELGRAGCGVLSAGMLSRTRAVGLLELGCVALTEFAAAVRDMGTRTSTMWCWWSADIVYSPLWGSTGTGVWEPSTSLLGRLESAFCLPLEWLRLGWPMELLGALLVCTLDEVILAAT